MFRTVISASIGAALICMAAGEARAAGGADPDWPCIQRRVPHLSLGQVWPGPQPDAAIIARAKSAEVRALANRIALRRIPMEEAVTLIAAFAKTSDAEGQTALFLATFDNINTARDRVLGGITRYAHKQAELASEITRKRHELSRLSTAEPPDFDAIDAVEKDIDWSTRVFRDRQQSLTYVCETPVILEQRAFALGRAVMQHFP